MPACLVVLGLLSVAAQVADRDAVPGAGTRRLQEAQAAYDSLQLDEARIALDRALRDPSNDRARLVQIYQLKGLVEASMGQPIAAKSAFSRMLVLAPDSSLSDDLSPKILSAFAAAQASLPGERGVAVESAAPEEILMGHNAELPIRVNDTLGMVEQLVVRYHIDDGEPVEEILNRTDQGVITLVAAQLPDRPSPYVVTLQAVAKNAFGAELAHLEPSDPRARVRVVAAIDASPLPWYERWWIWAGVAGGVVISTAVAVGLIWVLAPPDTSPRDIAVGVE